MSIVKLVFERLRRTTLYRLPAGESFGPSTSLMEALTAFRDSPRMALHSQHTTGTKARGVAKRTPHTAPHRHGLHKPAKQQLEACCWCFSFSFAIHVAR